MAFITFQNVPISGRYYLRRTWVCSAIFIPRNLLQQILVAANSSTLWNFAIAISRLDREERKNELSNIYIYSSNVPAYNRLFSFKMIHRPVSRRINWKYFWNIAFQILQVIVIVSIYFFFPTFCFPRNFKREREENIDWTFYERPFDHFYSRVKVKNIGCVNYRSIPLHKRLNKIGRNRRISRMKKFWTTILNKSQNLKMELLKITRLKNLSL